MFPWHLFRTKRDETPRENENFLDAVISGYAYETATTAIGVLEEGQGTKRWVGTEMLCTLDNFIKVVLFNERIFVTGCTDLKNNQFVPREADYGGKQTGFDLLKAENIFHTIPQIKGNAKAVENHITNTIAPVNINNSPLFVIECHFKQKQLTIFQELVYLDLYFIEYAIEQFGAGVFKPVFPGEHLYLGLRSRKIAIPQATQTMADIPGRRLRGVMLEKMLQINKFVSQGAPMLPELPPIFVSRILHECKNGDDFVPVLLRFRNSPAMKKLRAWMLKCRKMSESSDLAQRTKAAEALKKLEKYSPDDDIGRAEFLTGIFTITKNVVVPDPLEIFNEVIPQLAGWFLQMPFQALSKFSGDKIDPKQLDSFLKKTFGDRFNRGDMDGISEHLQLPDNLSDWGKSDAKFSVRAGRIYDDAPPLGRSFHFQMSNPAVIANSGRDFEDLLTRSVPFELIDALMKKGVPRQKIDEAMAKDNPEKELTKLLNAAGPVSKSLRRKILDSFNFR